MKDIINRREFIADSAKIAAVLAMGNINIFGRSKDKDFDVLIKNGTMYDGLGKKGVEMDIAILDDKIIKIGKKINPNKARIVIEAKGMVVSPGFIDAHTHTDTNLFINPKAESKIRQGVTTEINGNCGDSPVPISDKSFEAEKKRYKKEYDIDLNWKDMDGFLKEMDKRKISINFATLLGQGALREAVVGLNDVEPSKDQLEMMKQIVADCMIAGAVGISSGLEYTPSGFAKTDELTELCKVVAKYNGVYATHLRNEDDTLIEAIQEAIKISEDSKVSLQLSHLKTCYPRNWNKIEDMFDEIEKARIEGLNILADRYPYTAFSTGLNSCFDQWVREGSKNDFLSRLKDSNLDERLRKEMKQKEIKFGSFENVVISSVHKEENKRFLGRNVIDISKELNKEPYNVIRDILIDEDSHVSMIVYAMSEDNLKRILAHPLVVIGSDGSSIAPYGKLGEGKPHPRSYGTFARVLGKYVREEKIFPLHKAIQKMTSMNANKFGLKNRGVLKEGYFADITIFNPDTIIDVADFINPHRYAKGIEYVLVNGKTVIDHGEHTGELSGRVLRKGIA